MVPVDTEMHTAYVFCRYFDEKAHELIGSSPVSRTMRGYNSHSYAARENYGMSQDDGRSYGMYSRDDGKSQMMVKLEQMMENAQGSKKEAYRRAIEDLKNA